MISLLSMQFWTQTSIGQQAIFLSASLFGASFLSLLLKKIVKRIPVNESFKESIFNRSNRYLCSFLLTVVLLLPVYLATFSGSLSLIYGVFIAFAAVLITRIINTICSPVFKAPLTLLIYASSFVILANFYFPSLQVIEKLSFNVGKRNFSVLKLIKSSAVIAFFVWVAQRLAKKVDSVLSKNSRIDKSAHILFSKLTKIALLSFAIFLGTSLMGIDLFLITYFVGAIGIAVGLGLQNIISNVFCGVILLLDRSIKPGDVVSIPDKNAYGVIHSLNARYVSIRTRDGTEHLVPNEEFIKKKTENWTHTDSLIRFPVSFRVALDTDIEVLEQHLIGITNSIPRVLHNPAPAFRVTAIVENYIEVQLRLWISDPQNGTSSIKNTLYKDALKVFKKLGVEIPKPPLDIYIKQKSEDILNLKNIEV